MNQLIYPAAHDLNIESLRYSGYSPGQGEVIRELGFWLSTYPWDFFGTFVFATRWSYESSIRVWAQFINDLERYSRGRVAWVRGDERRWSGCDHPGTASHIHALLMFKNSRVYWPSADGLLTEAEVTFPVRDAWHKLAGRSDVRIYNPSLGGTYYVVKLSRYPPYNWDLGNLKYFRQVPQEAQSRRYLVRMAELRHPPLVGD